MTRGRREEFARFGRFRDPAGWAAIPDPNAPSTFTACKLRWNEISNPTHRNWLVLYRDLLSLRRRLIAPRLTGMKPGGAFGIEDGNVLRVRWTLGDGSRLHLLANFADAASHPETIPPGEVVYASPSLAGGDSGHRSLPAYCVAFTLEGANERA